MTVFIIAVLIAGLLNSFLIQPKTEAPDAPAIMVETVPGPGQDQVRTVPGMPHLVKYPEYYGGFGSCDSIAGRTVIVSVFADDMTSHWDFQNDEDVCRYTDIFRRVRSAAEWLAGLCPCSAQPGHGDGCGGTEQRRETKKLPDVNAWQFLRLRGRVFGNITQVQDAQDRLDKG